MHKSSLNKTSIVSNSILDIVHSDVWGLSPLTSVLGFNYYVIFVNDCTRFTWLFLLKHKHQVLSVFKHFEALVETQYFTKIKVLRTDNGIEYTNTAFQSFCSSNGILHLTSYPYTQQQNGVSERKHRHIVETGLSLLYKSNLPYNYWSYAFSIAVYLINRLPSSVLNFKSPWQSLYSKPPPLHSLISFGCACYPYLTPYNKNKLQPKSTECIFLGYPPLFKGYIYLDPSSNRIYIACFVLFNESLFPFTHNSACTNPNIPFTSDFSHWFPSSSPSTFYPTNVPSSCDSSFPLDLITSLIPSALTSSLPIPVVPSPPDPPQILNPPHILVAPIIIL